MKITFLGSGSAFTVGEDNFHSNLLIEDLKSGKTLLVDCGADVRFAIERLGLMFKDIDSVFISHVHADHTGGLEWLGFTRYFNHFTRPKLYLSQDIEPILWENTLSGGMSSLDDEEATLETFFELVRIGDNKSFEWQGYQFELVKTIHVISNGVHMPCYALYFTVNGQKVFFTADTRFIYDKLTQYYEEADVIFHDCETTKHMSGVHAHYNELVTLPAHIKKKTWLYHYNIGPKPKPEEEGFVGFVKRGQVFTF